MTHLEAFKLLKGSYWVTGTCQSGEECWCREILPSPPLFDDNGGELYVVGPGSMSKDAAEYIVKLHNSKLDGLLFDDHDEVIDYVSKLNSFEQLAVEFVENELNCFVFQDESDIVDYVQDYMNLVTFESDAQIVEYVLYNNLINDLVQSNTNEIDSMYRSDVISKIEELSCTIGWAKILEKLEK